jgi:hypothetical protein
VLTRDNIRGHAPGYEIFRARVDAAWNYAINNESFGQYAPREHAITAAIKDIDRMLFEASRSRRG